jgi:LmbE family N-acetylglucosaminyl deacetylase
MNILFIGSHFDDIELGAGGYLSKCLRRKYKVGMVIFSEPNDKLLEMPNKRKEEFFHCFNDRDIKLYLYDLEETKLPEKRQYILQKLEEIKEEFKPDVVICPNPYDSHQDHETVAKECIRSFKYVSTIISYIFPWNSLEIKPNYFIKLSKEDVKNKLKMISNYESQQKVHRHYFNREFNISTMRFYANMINCKYAEAYTLIRYIEE